jgi:negative elongation factor A
MLHFAHFAFFQWKLELEQILDVAVADSELWVSMLAEALKTYPTTGSLNTEISDLDEVRPIFTDLVSDLRKLVRKQAENIMLPMECHYLNKSALVSVVSYDRHKNVIWVINLC